MKRLMSMADFVEEIQYYARESHNEKRACELIFKYKDFLKQPLSIEMFVPCVLDGDVLEIPKPTDGDEGNWNYQARFNEYQQAKERCLFEGFQIEEHEMNTYSVRDESSILNPMWCFIDNIWVCAKGISTIEDLVKYNPKLTATALKQIL